MISLHSLHILSTHSLYTFSPHIFFTLSTPALHTLYTFSEFQFIGNFQQGKSFGSFFAKFTANRSTFTSGRIFCANFVNFRSYISIIVLKFQRCWWEWYYKWFLKFFLKHFIDVSQNCHTSAKIKAKKRYPSFFLQIVIRLMIRKLLSWYETTVCLVILEHKITHIF